MTDKNWTPAARNQAAIAGIKNAQLVVRLREQANKSALRGAEKLTVLHANRLINAGEA